MCDVNGVDVNFLFMIVYGSELDVDKIYIIIFINFFIFILYCFVFGLILC